MNLLIGSTVGDYEIISVLGAGGMGAVYKVRNTISDRLEALKVLLPDLAGQPELAERFLREIKLHATLDHPNIAALRTAVRHENQLLMVMELVEGVTLAERRQQGPIPLPNIIDYIDQVLLALSYAHERGVIHRDIKPPNIMLTPSGTVKLMDFGIAKGAADRKLTMTGATVGSLYYMSPEQIRGAAGIDSRSDLYSLGVCLYELVTNRRPFDGESQFDVMSAHLDRAPVPPISIDPSLPSALNDLILLSVNKDPNDRFQTAGAFRNALASVLRTPAAQATVTTIAPPAQPRSPRRGLWVAAGALCTALALIGIIQFGPWKKTTASEKLLEASPPAVPEPAQATPPIMDPSPVPGAVTAPQQPQQPQQSSHTKPVPDAKPAPQVATPPSTTPPSTPAAPEKTERSPAAPVETPTAVPPSQGPALQQIRESLAKLKARAVSIDNTLQNLQRRQAAGGLGLRGDWLESSQLMAAFLQGASDALAAADAPAARDLSNKAERHIEKLEKALNK